MSDNALLGTLFIDVETRDDGGVDKVVQKAVAAGKTASAALTLKPIKVPPVVIPPIKVPPVVVPPPKLPPPPKPPPVPKPQPNPITSLADINLDTLLDKWRAKGDQLFTSLSTGGKVSSKSIGQMVQIQELFKEVTDHTVGSVDKLTAKQQQAFAAQSRRLAEIQKLGSKLLDAQSDEQQKLKEGGIAFNGIGNAIGVAAGKYGPLVAQAGVFTAATYASYQVFRKIGDQIGVDQGAMESMLGSMQRRVASVNKEIVNGRTVSEGVTVATLTDKERVGYNALAPTAIPLFRTEYSAIQAEKTGGDGMVRRANFTAEQLRTVADAWFLAQQGGQKGLMAFQQQVTRYETTVDGAVRRAKEAIPSLQAIATSVQTGKPLPDVMTKEEREQKRTDVTGLITDEKAQLRQLQMESAALRGQRSKAAAIAAQIDQSEALKRRAGGVGAASDAQKELLSLADQTTAAAAANRAFSNSLQGIADKQAVVATKTETARLAGDDEKVIALTREQIGLQADLLDLEGKHAQAAATRKGVELQLNQIRAANLGDDMAVKQVELETAKMTGQAAVVRQLTAELVAMNAEKLKLEGKPEMAPAAVRQGATTATITEAASARDTMRTVLSLQSQITDSYRNRNINVLAMLKGQAREETRLQMEELALTSKTEQEKAAIRLKMSETLYVKLADLDFELSTGTEANLNRMVRAYGTTTQRIESMTVSLGQSLEGSLSQALMGGFTGDLKMAQNAFRGFIASIEQEIANTMAKAATRQFLLLLGRWLGNLPVHGNTMTGGGAITGGMLTPGLTTGSGSLASLRLGTGTDFAAGLTMPASRDYASPGTPSRQRQPFELHLTTVLQHDFLEPIMAAGQMSDEAFVQRVGAAIYNDTPVRKIIKGTIER